MGKLLDVQTVKNLTKPGRYTDALVRGLHLWVKAGGGKYWIFRYTFERRQRDQALGAFPALTIAKARLGEGWWGEGVREGVTPRVYRSKASMHSCRRKRAELLLGDHARFSRN